MKATIKPCMTFRRHLKTGGMYRAEMRKGNSLIQHSQLFIANIERKKTLTIRFISNSKWFFISPYIIKLIIGSTIFVEATQQSSPLI